MTILKDSVETPFTHEVKADDKAAAAAIAAQMAQAAHVASAKVIGYSQGSKTASIHVVYRIRKGMDVELPEPVAARLAELNLA